MYRPCWHSGCTFNCNKSTSLKKKKSPQDFGKTVIKDIQSDLKETRWKHCCYQGQLEISQSPAGEWEPWGSRKEVGHNQRSSKGESSPEKAFEWKEQAANMPVLRWNNGPEMETTHVGTCNIASQVQPHAGEQKLLLPLSWRTQQR